MHFALLEGGVFLVLGTITAASTLLSVLGDGDVSVVRVVVVSAVGEKVTLSCVTYDLRLLLNHSLLAYRAPSAVSRLREGNTAGASVVSLQLHHKIYAWRLRGKCITRLWCTKQIQSTYVNSSIIRW